MTVSWPAGFDRTPESEREPNRDFSVSLADAVADLERELDRLDPGDWSVSFGNQHAKTNGMPLHNANPSDPGFVVKWTNEDGDHAVACDAHTRLRDNVRQVWFWLRATRSRTKRPVQTGNAEFAAARLPPADGDPTGANAGATPMAPANGTYRPMGEQEARQVLGVPPQASEEEVRAAYTEKVKGVHPDQTEGDNTEAFQRVQAAKGVLLDD